MESRYGEDLKSYLSQHSLAELPSAGFFSGLSSLTASELCKVPGLTKLVLVAGNRDRGRALDGACRRA